MSDSVRPHRRQPTGLPHLWDFPGKNTGVGCHFLLQCMKVKVKVKSLSRVRLLVTPWTAAYQAPPTMGFSRQEFWNGVPLPSPKLSATVNITIQHSINCYVCAGTKLNADISVWDLVTWKNFKILCKCFKQYNSLCLQIILKFYTISEIVFI